jgi:very-short-patch-repair endonuclease
VWSGLGFDLHLWRTPHSHPLKPNRIHTETGRPNAALAESHPLFDGIGKGVHVHWSRLRFADFGPSWLASPMNAVWQALHCLDEENAIACLESAVHLNYLSLDQVREICRLAPSRLQRGIQEMEFTSDSGLETLVRRRLRHAGHTVVAQVHVNGLGDEDLVVDDCVALETDGAKWHGADRFQADRDRDLIVEGLGRRTLRLTHKHVMFEWETTLATIERVVADAQRARWHPVNPRRDSSP